MTAPVITGISFDQSYYPIGNTITATVSYTTTNEYTSDEFSPVVTDTLTEETSAATSATFEVALGGDGPYSYMDSFPGSSLSAYWNSPFATSGSSVSIGDDQVSVSLPGGSSPGTVNWGGIVAATAATLVSSSFSFQPLGIGAEMWLATEQASDSSLPYFGGINNYVVANISASGTLLCGWGDDSTDGNQQTVELVSYDPDEPFYVRIREESGTIYWDTSTDNATWVNGASMPDSTVSFDLTGLYATLGGVQHGDVGPLDFSFTNYAYIPEGAGLPDPTSVTATDTGDRTWTLVSNMNTGSSDGVASWVAVLTATA